MINIAKVASVLLLAGGCAAAKPPPPVVTSAEVRPPPPLALPEPQPVQVSPNLRASEELVAACNLNFENVDRAPKFDFDQSVLQASDNDVLGQIARCVMTGPLAGRSIGLVGHADPRGTGDYNLALGSRRASSVSAYLSSLGVDAAKMTTNSRGELDATGTDEVGWQRDRRVDLAVH